MMITYIYIYICILYIYIYTYVNLYMYVYIYEDMYIPLYIYYIYNAAGRPTPTGRPARQTNFGLLLFRHGGLFLSFVLSPSLLTGWFFRWVRNDLVIILVLWWKMCCITFFACLCMYPRQGGAGSQPESLPRRNSKQNRYRTLEPDPTSNPSAEFC